MAVNRVSKSRLLGALAAVVLLPGSAGAQSPPVLELFTSQGCDACPPADALIGEYIDAGGTVVLAYHVDYWDYQGWPDTFGRRDNTLRQQGYARAHGDMQIYTPQVVVNGIRPVVGSDRDEIERALAEVPAGAVPVTLAMMADAVSVTIGGAIEGGPRSATVWLVPFDRYEEVAIGRGENAGKTLHYYNIVRGMQRLAMWRGDAMAIDIPLASLREAGADGCAVLVQRETYSGLPGAILGAAILTPPGGYAGGP